MIAGRGRLPLVYWLSLAVAALGGMCAAGGVIKAITHSEPALLIAVAGMACASVAMVINAQMVKDHARR